MRTTTKLIRNVVIDKNELVGLGDPSNRVEKGLEPFFLVTAVFCTETFRSTTSGCASSSSSLPPVADFPEVTVVSWTTASTSSPRRSSFRFEKYVLMKEGT